MPSDNAVIIGDGWKKSMPSDRRGTYLESYLRNKDQVVTVLYFPLVRLSDSKHTNFVVNYNSLHLEGRVIGHNFFMLSPL